MPIPVDQIQLRFNPQSLALLNLVIATIMFGVALDIRPADFRAVARKPRAPLIGLVAQFILLPAITFALTMLIQPEPSISLGMILVAACPGGNVSNFMTHLSKGNTPLSIGMTAVSTVAAVVMTPLNLTFWGRMNPSTAALLRQIEMDPSDIFVTIVIILGIPLALGMLVENRLPTVAAKIRKPMKIFSMGFLIAFVGFALKANWDHFLDYVGLVVLAVGIQNASAFAIGYFSARVAGLPDYDARAISIEVGIQNSGLGLALIFTFFGGLGGAALVAAWWGIWHIIAGGTLATIWSQFPPKTVEA